MMKLDKTKQHNLLAVVSAAVAELPPSALADERIRPARVRSLLPLVGRKAMADACRHQVRVRDLTKSFCYADDAEAACAAYELAVRVVNPEHWQARIFLQDMAEWLMLPPREYRRLLLLGASHVPPQAA